MSKRFTIIQGGLSDRRPNAAAVALRAAHWRVRLARPGELDEGDLVAWRAFFDGLPAADPFADPDYLHSAASRAAGPDEVTFALLFASAEDGAEALCGVVPLLLPHPFWGGSMIRLWQPPLAPHPVEPAVRTEVAAAAFEALIARLRASRPRATLRLEGLRACGALVAALRDDSRLDLAERPQPKRIPESSFVDLRPPSIPTTVERAEGPAIRDAVERFLLADARASDTPLLSDPSDSTLVRVVTRLFARRGQAEVELGEREGRVVRAAIRLGAPGARITWRTIGRQDAPPRAETIGLDLRRSPEADAGARPARMRLIGG
ncbi:hypothetical protein [Methylobacterium organophilum]|uniref:Uncharacterized protein n=1 Tax=Methylobacterium organophilum TaxID=410 RepID=A0ABQ4TD52_METOR|nr:hypothetical protein [Methylobacterium organophilum]GJE28045.1 hypothetical protein LKMONMHP_2909 [Methylobacterium organophilum]